MSIGLKIRELRQRKGLTQHELAKRLGVSDSIIAMYEADKRNPSFENLMAIAEEFHVSAHDIIDDGRELSPEAQLPEDKRRLLLAWDRAHPTYQQLALEILELHPLI